MNHVSIECSLSGEGLGWLIEPRTFQEATVAKEEADFHAEIKKLFYPDT